MSKAQKLLEQIQEAKKVKKGKAVFNATGGGMAGFLVYGTLEWKGQKYKGQIMYNENDGLDYSFDKELPDEDIDELDSLLVELGFEAAAKL